MSGPTRIRFGRIDARSMNWRGFGRLELTNRRRGSNEAPRLAQHWRDFRSHRTAAAQTRYSGGQSPMRSARSRVEMLCLKPAISMSIVATDVNVDALICVTSIAPLVPLAQARR